VPDSIRPVREPTERSWTIYVDSLDGRTVVTTMEGHRGRVVADATAVEVVPVTEVERLRAERRELREALAFYDPHAPAAIEHECRNA
jgi:hypothetical protein